MIYRNTPQWFAAIDRVVGDDQDIMAKRSVNVRWPQSTNWWNGRQNRPQPLYSMIEARPDWVLSRQRPGVYPHLFHEKGALPTDADYLLRNEDVNARIAEALKPMAQTLVPRGRQERFLTGIVDPEAYDQVFDILDVWFDSGSTQPLFCAIVKMVQRMDWPTSIWKAPTNTVAGSIRPCCSPAAPRDARPIAGF